MKTKVLLTVLGSLLMVSSMTEADSRNKTDRPCVESKRATCDLLFWRFVKVKGGKDYCVNRLSGKRGEFTVPEGTTGILGDPNTWGWDLRVDREGSGRDHWCK